MSVIFALDFMTSERQIRQENNQGPKSQIDQNGCFFARSCCIDATKKLMVYNVLIGHKDTIE